jgi:hypothetical protein
VSPSTTPPLFKYENLILFPSLLSCNLSRLVTTFVLARATLVDSLLFHLHVKKKITFYFSFSNTLSSRLFIISLLYLNILSLLFLYSFIPFKYYGGERGRKENYKQVGVKFFFNIGRGELL